ncbi:hypothetical protein DL89DRAFT_263886 [Linderina pennispora]|uniref:F-box domain-containing protein n=1 Tax=Linderina pennispora TaxID=61395 RepID=A0A1Y1WJW4_9FUNG|nr:uncharacterized protein DL89DRAFT_263886 [Linderina pennispora]ORX73870.1 hypothetical protein DL89DRAFT_263886 [Linderina pennispora]
MATTPSLVQLPVMVLTKIFSQCDPYALTDVNSTYIRSIINTTVFRCAWACELANGASLPTEISRISDIQLIRSQVIGRVSRFSEFVRALRMHRPRLLNAIAPGLLWESLAGQREDVASLVVELSDVDLSMVDGRLARELIEHYGSVRLMVWMENNGLDFVELAKNECCFDFALLRPWEIRLPVRTLVDYALSNSTPELVNFLMTLDDEDKPSWDDLLLMACAEPKTTCATQPGILWTHAGLCVAAHASADSAAYEKFSVIRQMPGADKWLARSLQGVTPIERLCERLTFENLCMLLPFFREYIALGVPPTGMPSSVALFCQ